MNTLITALVVAGTLIAAGFILAAVAVDSIKRRLDWLEEQRRDLARRQYEHELKVAHIAADIGLQWQPPQDGRWVKK
jgi:hypothetical protein